MGRNITLGAWTPLATGRRYRVAVGEEITGAVIVVNDGSGGWTLYADVARVHSQAHVPGVVSWREAERCATRYLRRLVAAARAGVSA